MNNEYYPVTEKELDQIKNDCAHPETELCNGCEYEETRTNKCSLCTFKGANILMDEVLSRPDPLALLEAWRECKDTNWIVGCGADVWCEEAEFIKQLQENPEAVRQQGIEQGWWK